MGLFQNLFFKKGRDDGDLFNFPLEPLIRNFSFYDFCSKTKRPDNGGFVVITDTDYTIGYNSGFGEGSHLCVFARYLKNRMGGGIISNMDEAEQLYSFVERNFITARIVYEIYEDIETFEKRIHGYIYFNLNKGINKKEFEQFQKFYEKYNEEIKYVCKKFNFSVSFMARDIDGKKITDTSSSLDNILEYMKNNIVEEKEEPISYIKI